MTEAIKPGVGFTIVLMAGMTSQSLIFSPIAPVLPSIAAQAGRLGETVAQLSFALPSLGLIFAGFFAGGIIDRAGPRTAMIASLLLYMLAGTAPVLIDAPLPLLSTRLLTGFAAGLITTCATILLVAGFDGAARARMIGYQTSTGSALGLVTLIAGGAIAKAADWHLVFLLYGGVMAVFLLLALLSVPAIRPVRVAPTDEGSAATVLKLMWPVYLTAGLLFVIPTACGSLIPFLLKNSGTTDALIHAVVIACVSLGSMASGAGFGRIEAALGGRRTFALSLGVGTLGLLLIGIGRSPLSIGAGALLSGIALGLYFPYLWLVTTALASPEIRGRSLALMTSAMFLGGFLYPAIIGPLSALFGLSGAFLAIAVAMGAATTAAVIIPRGRLLLK